MNTLDYFVIKLPFCKERKQACEMSTVNVFVSAVSSRSMADRSMFNTSYSILKWCMAVTAQKYVTSVNIVKK